MFRFSLNNLLSQKIRSLLCVIGISIAVVGVICIFAFSQGIKSTVRSAIDLVDGVVVMEKGAVDPVLSSIPVDIKDEISNVNGVKNVIPWIWTPATTIEQISFSRRGFLRAEAIGGVDVEALARTPRSHLYPRNLEKGRFLKPGDQKKTVISRMLSKRYNKNIGDTILIRGIDFEIVGIYSVGNKLLDVAYIVPIEMARKMKSMARSTVSNLFVVPEDNLEKEDIIRPVENALQNYDVKSTAANRIKVYPKSGKQKHIPLQDAKRLRRLKKIKQVIPELYSSSIRIARAGEGTSFAGGEISILGLPAEILASPNFNSLYGRDANRDAAGAEKNDSGTILLKPALVKKMNLRAGDEVLLNETSITVGGSFEPSEQNRPYSAIVSLETAWNMGILPRDTATSLSVIPAQNTDPNKLIPEINEFLLEWDVRTQRDWETDFSDLMGQIDILLMLISSLAIIVGMVGIINTMLMSVTERTSEFGILISSGWSKGDLLRLVLSESLLLGVSGGVVGVIVGWSCVQLVNHLFELTINASTPPLLLILSFALSIFVGVGGGLYPAWRAARMDPIDAIRSIR